ncbi:MAG: hypothetical protein ACRC41_18215, partial [Sarcina sp.]
MIHSNMPINIQRVNRTENTKVLLTGKIKVIVKNQAGVPLKVYEASGQTGSRIGNIISKLDIPSNAKITSISIEGKLYEGQAAINELNNTIYGNQDTLSIVVNVEQQVNVMSNIYLNNRMVKEIQTNNDIITSKKAILYFPNGLFKSHHITWIEINGQKFTHFVLDGNKLIVTGSIPVPQLTTYSVIGNFDNGAQKDFPVNKPAKVKPAEKTPEASKPKVDNPAKVKPAEKTPEASKPKADNPTKAKPAEKTPETSKPKVNNPAKVKPAETTPEASKPKVDNPAKV